MKIKISRKKLENNELHFTLSGDMNIYTAAGLKKVLINDLKDSSGIKMNLSAVEEADTAAFQLLLFLKREAMILGKSFQITEMSARLKSIFTLYDEMI